MYLTSFEEINKSTYQCKQCKAASHVINIFLRIRNHVLPYFVGPTALEKKQSSITKKRNSRL